MAFCISSPATIEDEGLADEEPLTPFAYPDFTQELGARMRASRPAV